MNKNIGRHSNNKVNNNNKVLRPFTCWTSVAPYLNAVAFSILEGECVNNNMQVNLLPCFNSLLHNNQQVYPFR